MRPLHSYGMIWLSFAFLLSLAAANSVSNRIVVVGDLHGDVDQARLLLRMCKLIDMDNLWIGGNATLVQLGDMIDRGPRDKSVIFLLRGLQEQAKMTGGGVVVLLGNHELMNLQGQFHYTHPESDEEFGGKKSRARMLRKGTDLGDYLRQLPVFHVAQRSLFVHAGISPSWAEKGVDHVNAMAREALAENDFTAAIFQNSGPLWTRRTISDAVAGRCDDIRESLRRLEVDRMFVGHTPQRSGHIESFCDGSLVAVDVGISRWMFGNLAAVEMVQSGSEVELLEITTSSEVAKNAQPSTLDEAIKSDPFLLQELLEAVAE